MTHEIEFHLDNLKISEQLELKVRNRYKAWRRGHHDITNAYFSLKQLSGKKSVHEYEAKIVLYHRPENIVVTFRAPAIPEAVTGAVQTMDRRVRETRAAYRDKRTKAEVQLRQRL